jgi:hypothetical protein
MRSKSVLLAMLVFLSMVPGRAESAQEGQLPEQAWLGQMHADGWRKLQEGVLQRDVGEGRFETFGYGAEGYQWLAERYSQHLAYFEGKYREAPTDELAALIGRLSDKIDTLQDEALAAPAAESFDESRPEGCSFSYDATVYAGPSTSTQGVMAEATASFNSTCGTIGRTFALAYAHATKGSLTTTHTESDDPSEGALAYSQAFASAEGSMECESRAEASVEITDLNIFLIPPPAVNYQCPDVVSITGPGQVVLDYYGQACADVTWSATPTSGRTDYTFEWYIDDILQYSTGPTLTEPYCSESANVTVRTVAIDSTGARYETPPFTTNIQYIGPISPSISGPASVTTSFYGPTCVDVTWTAEATGGHPGYTYSWYLGTGTGTAVQGTSPALTKSVCSTSQSVTVKVVDSDAHTATKTFTTDVQYTPALAASINGPTSVTTDYYGPTCANVTWTASAIGGHSGYTYSWYLGTSTGTTVQSTASTFTKSLCTANQSVTVKVLDSDGHSATKTFTTSVQYKGAIVAAVSGPATVTAPPCIDVTWTAGASSSGHSGFTYKWYLGTTTTTAVKGTGTTFTQRYCTAQTVKVTLLATASDGHSDDVTFTTTITTPPLAASISGLSEAEIYGTQCITLTWNANVSGGTPAYRYSWTIGTSTTVLSTTSSLTKTYCNGANINVKLTVRDSASQPATATTTFTTNVYKEICFDGLCQ